MTKTIKKLISLTLSIVLMTTCCLSIAPTVSAATTPNYKVADINSSNKVTGRTDYYDIRGNKKISFEFAYQICGVTYPKLFSSAFDTESDILKSSVRFDYKIYRNGKLLKSGTGLRYNDKIKVTGNTFRSCRVYITSYFVSNGKTLYLKNGNLYAKGYGINTVKYSRYHISY